MAAGGLVAAGCATSPLGRKQLMLVPNAEMAQMGIAAFDQIKAQETVDRDAARNHYVQCIVARLAPTVAHDIPPDAWEVVVFDNPSANAFALPGAKIGVYTGILKVAQTDAQLAAVLGHEIGHVLAHHGAERVSQQTTAQLGEAAVGVLAADSPHRDLYMGLLGVGTQVGVLLPFSRTQESEADLIGLRLMAEAGFDPHDSVALWRNMQAQGDKAPPPWLSTHPANASRIDNLEAHMADAVARQPAKAPPPHCVRP